MKEIATVLAEHWLEETLNKSLIGEQKKAKSSNGLIPLYRVNSWRYDIKKVFFAKVDNKKAYRKDGFSYDLNGQHEAFFHTEDEAVNWLFEHERNEILMAKKQIKRANNRLEKLENLYKNSQKRANQ